MIAVTICEWLETLRSSGRREVRPVIAADKTILKESTDLETFLFFIILVFLIAGRMIHIRYVKSDNGSASGRSFAGTLLDKGTSGEFMIYSHLEKLGEPNRLLPHLHLPKSDGTTIDIDLVMIARTGIYVFESKNFSGCIFGDEDSRYWTQTMKRGPKQQFYNPIWQNESRISSLKRQLPGARGRCVQILCRFQRSVHAEENVRPVGPRQSHEPKHDCARNHQGHGRAARHFHAARDQPDLFRTGAVYAPSCRNRAACLPCG